MRLDIQFGFERIRGGDRKAGGNNGFSLDAGVVAVTRNTVWHAHDAQLQLQHSRRDSKGMIRCSRPEIDSVLTSLVSMVFSSRMH